MNASHSALRQPPPVGAAPTPVQLAARARRHTVNFLNKLIARNEITDLIQFDCGDGRLLGRLKIAAAIGLDGSFPAVSAGSALGGPVRQFLPARLLPPDATADLTLSIEVVNRLAGQAEFNAHFRALFGAARRYVVVNAASLAPAWSATAPAGRFAQHVARYFPAWRLAAQVSSPVPSAYAGLFVYARDATPCVIPVLPAI